LPPPDTGRLYARNLRGRLPDRRGTAVTMKTALPARIGPYEILAPLGAGSMGEVYRALDVRLHREVAVKVLPDGVSGDPHERQGLLNEARAAGALSHPNILSVYDIGLEEATAYIVTELVAGRRLRDEIERGPLPVRRLLDIATQVAAGLAAAHEAGIVHGDLKPENVMVTPDGRCKIVDFGLARVRTAAAGGIPDAHTRGTLPLIGTPEYLSPEQARGAPGDFRSDQFAFGLMLYEMGTGTHPFRHDGLARTLEAIAEREAPPLAQSATLLPAPLRWLIERCLAKDPIDRYASTRDLAAELDVLRSRLPEVVPAAPERRAAGTGLTGRRLALAAGVVVLSVLAAGSLRSPGSPHPGTYRPLVSEPTFQGAPSWSPDGRTLAYVAQVDGILQVFTYSLMSSQSSPVTRSFFDCHDPFWSLDGTRIFYHSLQGPIDGLWSVSVAGGPSEPVLDNTARATMSSDGRSLAFLRGVDPAQPNLGYSLWVASVDGSDARRYLEPPFDQRAFVEGTLRFAPDGSALLARVWGLPDEASGAPSPQFWMIPWPSGRAYEILPSLSDSIRAAVAFDWLPDSRHVVTALWDDSRTATHLWRVDTRTGRADPLTMTPRSENRPSVSPDGSRLAFTFEEVDFDLIEIPLDGSAARPLLASSRNELDPAFSTDGAEYVYVTDRTGTLEIWLRRRDAWGERRVAGAGEFPEDDPTWALGSLALSPDGSRVAYQRYGARTGYQVWVSALTAGPAMQLAPGGLYQDAPTWSPDGEWLALLQRTGDDLQLVKIRFGRNEPPVPIAGSMVLYSPVHWSPDGRWILADTLHGLAIVDPDGRDDPHIVSDEIWITYGWSADSARIVGLREAERRRFMLVELDIRTLEERVLNPDVGPIPLANQPVRGFSRAGDAFVTSLAGARSEIWMLEGFARPDSWLRRFAHWR
jgi:eukaryotic-like serine/threonine-protein kinase